MASPEPEPGRSRFEPPPRLKTALATRPPSDRSVVLNLLNRYEEDLFAEAFRAIGWQVTASEDIDWAALENPDPLLVVTDDPALPRNLSRHWSAPQPSVVVLVDDRDTAVEGAQNAGADWVVTRPLDFEKPLAGWPIR